MTFKIENTPNTFQRAMDVIITPVKWQIALTYLDDIVKFSRMPEEHVTR